MRTLKYILLPVLGIVAAILAFQLASPYTHSLDRSNMSLEDARALFTYGSKWGAVNRIAFGALMCGPFALVLSLGRRVWWRTAIAFVAGAVIGGAVNYVTDSSADIVGIAIATKNQQLGSLVAMLMWCFFVPLGIALSITVALGPTTQRMRRAWYATRFAAIGAFCAQIVGGMMVPADMESDPANALISQIPVWRTVEIVVGLIIGLLILVADEVVRVGTIRLVHGKNEFRDWSIDNLVTKIGSAETNEIMIRGYKGVEPLHVIVAMYQGGFLLDAKAPTLLNGQTVTQAMLRSSDQIQIGDATLVFTARDGGYTFAPRPAVIPYPTGPIQASAPGQGAAPLYVAPSPGGMKNLVDAYGNQVSLPPGRYSVGREMSNAICLQHDASVSPKHAELVVTDIDLSVVDLGTGMSTRINGFPVSGQVKIHMGDTVEFGTCRFTYVS